MHCSTFYALIIEDIEQKKIFRCGENGPEPPFWDIYENVAKQKLVEV